jgi:type II secretory pathway pseudopilin PulG
MLIVIVLIGILAGITATRLDWVRYRADSVARGVMAELSQAQRTAVSLQTDVRVATTATDRIRIHEDANNNGAMDSGERITYLVVEEGFTIGRGSMAALPAPASGTELTALIFRRDGTASTSGAFYLRGPASDASCHYCRAVEVTRATGRVVIYSLATGAWTRGN